MDMIEKFFVSQENCDIESIHSFLISKSVEEILDIICRYSDSIKELSASNIPQFSRVDAVDTVLQIVDDSAEEPDRQYIGYMINKKAKEGAQRKYGENHVKLAISWGLLSEKPLKVTPLGRIYMNMDKNDKFHIQNKLSLRIPVVQYILINSKNKKIDGTDVLRSALADSTAKRRRSNVKKLINNICKDASIELKKQIMDNIYWS